MTGDRQNERCNEVYRILAVPLRRLLHACRLAFDRLQEIRLRVGLPMILVYDGAEYFVDGQGQLTKEAGRAVRVTREHLSETMEYISNYSMYAFEEELRQGYLTVCGGHRVGVAGRLLLGEGGAKNMRHISFLNIRVAHEIIGCADKVLPFLFEQGRFLNTLLISPPCCGKTTLLRDIVRQVSDGTKAFAGMTVGVVDERSELGACYLGAPQNRLGCRTDVLDGCPKVQGMMMLVRSMAPQVIAVDEVGSREDVEAMSYIINCGIRLLATVHGNCMDDIRKKPMLGEMVRGRAFERYILLKGRTVGEIGEIFDARGTLLFSQKWGLAC